MGCAGAGLAGAGFVSVGAGWVGLLAPPLTFTLSVLRLDFRWERFFRSGGAPRSLISLREIEATDARELAAVLAAEPLVKLAEQPTVGVIA